MKVRTTRTGVGIGTLLVKMRSKGVKLSWNERFVNGRLLQEEAKFLISKQHFSSDGDVTIAQDNVHYLYSRIHKQMEDLFQHNSSSDRARKLCDDGSNTWWKLSGSTDQTWIQDYKINCKEYCKAALVLPGGFCINQETIKI